MPNAMKLNNVVDRFNTNEMGGSSSDFDAAGLIDKSIEGEVIVPDGTTEIGAYAFYGCQYITKLELPEGVSIINDYAFMGCSGMTNIVLPEGITEIGHMAFRGCAALKKIIAPMSCKKLLSNNSDTSFSGCDVLELAKFPGVTSIEGYGAKAIFAGVGMNSQNGLVMNFDSLKVVPGNLFSGSGATKIYMPAATTVDISFQGANKLAEVYIGPNCTSIAAGAFGGTKSGIVINCGFAEGAVSGAPWAAQNATINYNVPVPNND